MSAKYGGDTSQPDSERTREYPLSLRTSMNWRPSYPLKQRTSVFTSCSMAYNHTCVKSYCSTRIYQRHGRSLLHWLRKFTNHARATQVEHRTKRRAVAQERRKGAVKVSHSRAKTTAAWTVLRSPAHHARDRGCSPAPATTAGSTATARQNAGQRAAPRRRTSLRSVNKPQKARPNRSCIYLIGAIR